MARQKPATQFFFIGDGMARAGGGWLEGSHEDGDYTRAHTSATDRQNLQLTTNNTYSFCNAHRSSPTYVTDSTATPLFTALISSVLSFVIPTPTANSFPSASNPISVPAGSAASAGGSHPPADVRPGHIMCAPASRKRIAPRSMRTCGRMNGSTEACK